MGFKDRLRQGYELQRQVARDMLDLGLAVYLPPLRIRPTFEERAEYSDDGDIFFKWSMDDDDWQVCEVKGRSLSFTGVEDYPYETVFAESSKSFDSRPGPASVYVIHSADNQARIVLHGKSVHTMDRIHKGPSSFLAAPLDQWVDWDDWASSITP